MSEREIVVFGLPSANGGALRCAACGYRACESIGTVPGVHRVECDAGGGLVRIEFDPARVSEADLSAEMERFGLAAGELVRHVAWRVTGLD